MSVQAQSTTFELSPQHDIRNLHGAPGWFELATKEPTTAVAYLRELYGWEFQEIDLGGIPYFVILLKGHEIGGIRAAGPGDPDEPRWSTYVTVEDADSFASRAAGLGATIVVSPMQLGEAGRMTAVRHPAAGMLLAFQYPRPFS